MVDLQELEKIKRLKYKYQRCLDLHHWDELEECFVPEATSSYGDGQYSFGSRDEIMSFLKGAMDRASNMSSHHVHHPEIDIDGDRATGIWALEDYVVDAQEGHTIHGAAYYHDQYVKVEGEWKIKHTGYKRAYEERLERKNNPHIELTVGWGVGD